MARLARMPCRHLSYEIEQLVPVILNELLATLDLKLRGSEVYSEPVLVS